MCDGIHTKEILLFKLSSKVWTSINKFGLAVDLPTRSRSMTLSESLNMTMRETLLYYWNNILLGIIVQTISCQR